MIRQLENEGRNFVYHVKQLSHRKKQLKRVVNNGRDYVIHINMQQNCNSVDQLEAYLVARLIDIQLKKVFEDFVNSSDNSIDDQRV